MNKLLYFTFSSILLFLMIITLLNPALIIKSVINSSSIFLSSLFPSLFPFFIIAYFLINYNVIYNITKIITHFFKIDSNLIIIVLLSMLSGYPGNAKYINEMYEKNIIDENDASKLLYITFFPGPMYVLGTIGSLYLNDYKSGLIILISIYLTNLILISRFKFSKSLEFKNKTFKPIGYHIKESIITSINTLLVILGSIIIFSTLLNVFNYYFNFQIVINLILNSILEMSSACSNIAASFINTDLKIILISLTLVFSGICIHCQMLSIITFKIKYSTLLKYRVFALLINFIIITILVANT